jgi:hypothetical protein
MNNISPHPPTLPHAGLRLRAATVNPHAPGHQQMLKSGRRTGYYTEPSRTLVAINRPQSKFGHDRETAAMKTFTVAVAILALIAMPAHAQMGGKRNRGGDDKKTDQKKPQVDEKAYKAALERIPEPKEKYDPWGVARPADPAKKPK